MAEASTLYHRPHRLNRARGFTYSNLIIMIAIIALITVSTVKLGYVLQRSKAEQELLDIGAAFSDALKSYADATPQGQPTQPPSLQQLLKDPRLPGTRRHLRKIFVDPMTGKAEWGIVYLGDKVGVLAVYSLSETKPLKIGNFPLRFVGFEGKGRISEWKFTMATEGPVSAPVTGPQAQTTMHVSDSQQTLDLLHQNLPAPISPLTLPQPAPVKMPAPQAEVPIVHSDEATPEAPEQPLVDAGENK